LGESDLISLLQKGDKKLREGESKNKLMAESIIKKQNVLLEKIVLDREERRSCDLQKQKMF